MTIPRCSQVSGALPLEWGGSATDREILAGLFGSLDDEEWQDGALCAQVDGDLFFPEKGGSTKEAKSICHRCEVRAECLEYALANSIRDGVWGGMAGREREFLKRTGEPRQPKIRASAIAMAERGVLVTELFDAGLSRNAIAVELHLTRAQVDASRTRIRRGAA